MGKRIVGGKVVKPKKGKAYTKYKVKISRTKAKIAAEQQRTTTLHTSMGLVRVEPTETKEQAITKKKAEVAERSKVPVNVASLSPIAKQRVAEAIIKKEGLETKTKEVKIPVQAEAPRPLPEKTPTVVKSKKEARLLVAKYKEDVRTLKQKETAILKTKAQKVQEKYQLLFWAGTKKQQADPKFRSKLEAEMGKEVATLSQQQSLVLQRKAALIAPSIVVRQPSARGSMLALPGKVEAKESVIGDRPTLERIYGKEEIAIAYGEKKAPKTDVQLTTIEKKYYTPLQVTGKEELAMQMELAKERQMFKESFEMQHPIYTKVQLIKSKVREVKGEPKIKQILPSIEKDIEKVKGMKFDKIPFTSLPIRSDAIGRFTSAIKVGAVVGTVPYRYAKEKPEQAGFDIATGFATGGTVKLGTPVLRKGVTVVTKSKATKPIFTKAKQFFMPKALTRTGAFQTTAKLARRGRVGSLAVGTAIATPIYILPKYKQYKEQPTKLQKIEVLAEVPVELGLFGAGFKLGYGKGIKPKIQPQRPLTQAEIAKSKMGNILKQEAKTKTAKRVKVLERKQKAIEVYEQQLPKSDIGQPWVETKFIQPDLKSIDLLGKKKYKGERVNTGKWQPGMREADLPKVIDKKGRIQTDLPTGTKQLKLLPVGIGKGRYRIISKKRPLKKYLEPKPLKQLEIKRAEVFRIGQKSDVGGLSPKYVKDIRLSSIEKAKLGRREIIKPGKQVTIQESVFNVQAKQLEKQIFLKQYQQRYDWIPGRSVKPKGITKGKGASVVGRGELVRRPEPGLGDVFGGRKIKGDKPPLPPGDDIKPPRRTIKPGGSPGKFRRFYPAGYPKERFPKPKPFITQKLPTREDVYYGVRPTEDIGIDSDIKIGTEIGLKELQMQRIDTRIDTDIKVRSDYAVEPIKPVLLKPTISYGDPFRPPKPKIQKPPKVLPLTSPTMDRLFGGYRPGIPVDRRRKRKTKYAPSLAAIVFDIYGTRPRKKLTGLEFRPIIRKKKTKKQKKR